MSRAPVLLTGATGFIGGRLFESFRGKPVRLLGRTPLPGTDTFVADLAEQDRLRLACEGVETVYHCAGYAHAFSAKDSHEAAAHWRINHEGSRNLVEAAGQAGVRRFVFLSSIKAMGDPGDRLVDEDWPAEPETAYGQAKRAAESAVLEAGQKYGMHVVNLRLSMVYGRGGRGNLERMARLVARGLFPPLPETGNHRSLVHVQDVVRAMHAVAMDDRARGRTYIVAGQDAPSGRQLFDALRHSLGLPECRWAVPAAFLRAAARAGDLGERLMRRRLPLDSEVLERLLGSAWYSSERIERELGWRGEVGLLEGLREMVGG